MKLKRLAVAWTLAASLGSAATLTLDQASGDWVNWIFAPDLAITPLDEPSAAAALLTLQDSDGLPGNDTIRWSTNQSSDGINLPPKVAPQSGLAFHGSPPPALMVNTGTPFVLGMLTHFNRQVENDFIVTNADLDIASQFTLAGKSGMAGPFKYAFIIDETLNIGGPVDDIIDFAPASLTPDTFAINGQTFSLTLLGLTSDGGITFTKKFVSPEGNDNQATLWARVDEIGIPEPSSLALSALALAALGMALRRRG